MDMFNDIDKLEDWYKKDIISIKEYFSIKSAIVDYYRNLNIKTYENDDLPF